MRAPQFDSLKSYIDTVGDPAFWRRYVQEAASRHDLMIDSELLDLRANALFGI